MDSLTAESLQLKLIENGIITSQANTYGIHKATKPLYETAFMNVSDAGNKALHRYSEFFEPDETDTFVQPQSEAELESEFRDLQEKTESQCEEEVTSADTGSDQEEIVVSVS